MKMRKFLQNKLWRDKAADRYRRSGSIIHTKPLSPEEYHEQLGIKLAEEALEVKTAESREQLVEEIADVMEVIEALLLAHHISQSEITEKQKAKRDERGGFLNRELIIVAEHPEGSFGAQYCLEQPNKYPEIIE